MWAFGSDNKFNYFSLKSLLVSTSFYTITFED